jgi:imidazolonepropionase-like amidohydrolase
MTRTVIRGGRVWDGRGETSGVGDLAFENGIVTDVGAGLDGDIEVDGTGMTVVPGFIDCHVHVGVTQLDYLRLIRTRPSYRMFEAARNLETTLRAGVTTVRDAGGADAGIRDAVRDGLILGPRMQVAITILSQTGGHGDHFSPCGVDIPLMSPPGAPDGVVDGVDAMRRRAREIIRAGADVLKVCTSGGVLSSDDDPRHAQFQMDELDALLAEAGSVHLPVMAHAQSTRGIKNALQAGVTSIEHGIYLDDEAVDLMMRQGTFLVPTISAARGVLAAAEAGMAIPQESVDKAREVVDAHETSFRLALSAGVKIAMGTDAPAVRHGANLTEIVRMNELGMTAGAAMRSATSLAADLLGLGDITGTLEAGKAADLVLVDGDPLHDLSGLPERVRGVWREGIVVPSQRI